MTVMSLFKRWQQLHEEHHAFWSIFFMVMVSASFVVSDWMWGIFTFSEYILGLTVVLMFLIGQYKVEQPQWKWLLSIVGFLLIHVMLSGRINEEFHMKAGIAGLIKISFYLFIVTGVYNYIRRHNLERKFLIWNNLFAVAVCLIGVYITVSLYSDGELPYKFFWEFTRWDIYSYLFNENPNIIRTRSIFSEPSYLGYYLNTILAINFFNKNQVKVHWFFSLVLSITVLLTFSYSAIAILFIILLIYTVQNEQYRLLLTHKAFWMIAAFLLILIIFFWDIIDRTLLERTKEILSGEDASGYLRLIGSWQYLNTEHLWLGNGIGHTPAVWNIYAYMLSDLGLAALLASIVFSGWLIWLNVPIGVVFTLSNMAKGGYLSSSFWIMILLVLIYIGPKSGIKRKASKITDTRREEIK